METGFSPSDEWIGYISKIYQNISLCLPLTKIGRAQQKKEKKKKNKIPWTLTWWKQLQHLPKQINFILSDYFVFCLFIQCIFVLLLCVLLSLVLVKCFSFIEWTFHIPSICVLLLCVYNSILTWYFSFVFFNSIHEVCLFHMFMLYFKQKRKRTEQKNVLCCLWTLL